MVALKYKWRITLIGYILLMTLSCTWRETTRPLDFETAFSTKMVSSPDKKKIVLARNVYASLKIYEVEENGLKQVCDYPLL